MRPFPPPSPRQRPVTRHDGYGGAVRYGDSLCPTISANCFTATFMKSSARVMRRAAEQRLRTSIPKTVCCMCRPAYSSASKPSTNLLAISAGPTRTSFTPRTARPRPCTMSVVWLGIGLRDEPPNYTGLDVVIVRDVRIAALYVFLDPVQV